MRSQLSHVANATHHASAPILDPCCQAMALPSPHIPTCSSSGPREVLHQRLLQCCQLGVVRALQRRQRAREVGQLLLQPRQHQARLGSLEGLCCRVHAVVSEHLHEGGQEDGLQGQGRGRHASTRQVSMRGPGRVLPACKVHRRC
jgi:hypothetical protein